MIKEVVRHFNTDGFTDEVKIINPFCGDGRLIVELLQELLSQKKLPRRIYTSYWDIDGNAVEKVSEAICTFKK